MCLYLVDSFLFQSHVSVSLNLTKEKNEWINFRDMSY